MCKQQANLLHADRVFILLLQELRHIESPVAEVLLENLKKGILKRRTILSSILQVLDDPKYDFELETEIGQTKPSNREIIDVGNADGNARR